MTQIYILWSFNDGAAQNQAKRPNQMHFQPYIIKGYQGQFRAGNTTGFVFFQKLAAVGS